MLEVRDAKLSRKIYSQKKENIISLLDHTIEFYSNENDMSKKEVFETLKEDLVNGEFSIVVVGEFSAGKSTLLNALMRKRILPSFTNETTATVNFLRHCDRAENGEAGKVFYRNGKQEILDNISLDVINQYVSTKGENVANSIEHLDLYLDSEFLKDGVTLVDSPGLNGVADGHREITEQQILKSHASIFLFNSDHPGSKTDFEFLYDLERKVKTIIFVLNKIDNIKEDEGETVESVIDSLKKSYKKQFPEATSVPEIWPVAAYQALCARTQDDKKNLEEISRLQAFENRLLTFLTCGEKAHQQLMAPIERVIAVLKDSQNMFSEDMKVLQGSVDTEELERQILGIQEIIDNLSMQMKESKKNVSEKVAMSLREVTDEISAQITRLQTRKLQEIDNCDDYEELSKYLQSFEEKFLDRMHALALEGKEILREKIMMILKMQYLDDAELIEQKINMEDSEFKFEIHNHLDDNEQDILNVGLKEMGDKTEKLEEELRRLKKEAAEAEDDFYKARSIENKSEKLKIEIQNMREVREIISKQMLPPVHRYTEEVHTTRERDGLLGKIGNFFLGEKEVVKNQLIVDSKEYDEAKNQRDAELAKQDSEIQEKQTILKQYNTGADSSLLEKKYMRKLEEVYEVTEKLKKHQDESTKKIDANYQKEIKRLKRKLTNYCDDNTEDLMKQVKKELKVSESRYVNAVLEIVEANLRDEMNEKRSRIVKLQDQMKSSEDDRNKKIKIIEQKLQHINKILENAVDLQIDLENEKIDIIEHTEL